MKAYLCDMSGTLLPFTREVPDPPPPTYEMPGEHRISPGTPDVLFREGNLRHDEGFALYADPRASEHDVVAAIRKASQRHRRTSAP